MLSIRAEQMHALDEQIEREFSHRLAHTLSVFFPSRFARLEPASVDEFALACVKRARSLGLHTEGSIARYANLCALVGIGFENTSAAANAGLAPSDTEDRDPSWLDRIVPLVQRMIAEGWPP
jgi:hypothetical protein